LGVARLVSARRRAKCDLAHAQVRGIACQHPNSLVYVAGAPSHEQCEAEGDPWVKMEAGFSVRHHIQPMRDIVDQCDVPPENMVSAPSPHQILYSTSRLLRAVHTNCAGRTLQSRAARLFCPVTDNACGSGHMTALLLLVEPARASE